MIEAHSSLREIAFAVCTALDKIGITAVLTGGSAATIWSDEAYQSRDCDFIITFAPHNAPGKQTLNALGFSEKGGTYKHSKSPFTVEFPPGPLSVGDEMIIDYDTLVADDQILHILNPTDSCRDRLAAFYHWNDFSSLEVALAIAEVCEVDLLKIQNWSKAEGVPDKFEQFQRRLTKS